MMLSFVIEILQKGYLMDNSHKSCYGKMFPSILAVRVGNTEHGKAFSISLDSSTGMFVTDQNIDVDMEQWDDCLTCEEFEHCGKLAQAKLSLEIAVSQARQ